MAKLLACSVALISVAVGCSKQNPALCCETNAECATVGFSEFQPCEEGVCVLNECADTGCDGNEDCASPTPVCVDGGCAECATSDDCPSELPVCDPTHRCVACFDDATCPSGACDLMNGTCVPDTAVLYVAPTGSDTAPCTPSEPCSLAHAFGVVDPAHAHIVMTPGSYVRGGTLDGRRGTLIGRGASLEVNTENGQIFVVAGGALTIRELAINKSSTVGVGLRCQGPGSSLAANRIDAVTTYGIAISATTCTVDLNESVFSGEATSGMTAGILVDTGSALTVDRCEFRTENGVISNSSGGTIANSVFESSYDALFIGASRFRIAYNTIVGGNGIECGTPVGTPQQSEFVGNIIVDVATINAPAGCNYNYNLVTPEDTTLGGTGNITGDPLFEDRAGGDFHLRAGSPAINAGDPSSPEDHDFDGAPRPQDGRADIGAFELQP